MRLAAIILTGGRSRRMGRPKEALPFGDTTLLGWQCRTLAAAGALPIVVVARDAEQPLPPLPPGVDQAHDAAPDQGPLAAIAAGLARLEDHHGLADGEVAFVAACDLPYLRPDDVRFLLGLLGTAPVLMPRSAGLLQPLAAAYRLRCRRHAENLLQHGERTPRQLALLPGARIVEEAELRAHDPTVRFLRNVNTDEDYRTACRDLLPPGGAT
jgi:molybdenum cofactor guanylyltransferase